VPAPRPERPAARAPAPAPPRETLEGFGSATRGGDGGRVLVVAEATDAAVRTAFTAAANGGHAIVRFAVAAPIVLARPLPVLRAPAVTIEGNGATLDGGALGGGSAIVDVRTNDVVVRDLRLRNGYDNLRIQGPEAFDVVVTHVSSTGARDDGIAIGYGAHDVTVQYAFLAGNTRSVFCKYGGTANLSLHHSWIQKGWIRNPLLSGVRHADLRNLIVEDWGEWGARFEDGASGNLVDSLFVLSPRAIEIGGKPGAALRLVRAGAVYTAGNVFRGGARAGDSGGAPAPLAAPAVATQTADAMEAIVRARAGCLPRDAVDRAYAALTDGWTVGPLAPLRPALSAGGR
jgi:hypothetical protein